MSPNLDITNITQAFPTLLFAKGITLLFLLLYVIFTLVALINIRSLHKLVVINPGEASRVVQILFLSYVGIVIILFFAAIVIL